LPFEATAPVNDRLRPTFIGLAAGAGAACTNKAKVSATSARREVRRRDVNDMASSLDVP
jgi:hypothetical protein